MSKNYLSWGRYPAIQPRQIIQPACLGDIPPLNHYSMPVLAYGMGRSYGDCCLNENGTLLDTTSLSGIILFDKNTGLLRCEAGLTLADILVEVVPHGWFLPVIPGTKFVTVGGAIANDIHGKNHHLAGTFGCHVLQFELLRSDGTKIICTRKENNELFQATIGGLGLTGLILWADIQLKSVKNPFIKMESIRFDNFHDFFEISSESDATYEYTVAWIDCIAKGNKLGRGIFMRGNHADPGQKTLPKEPINRQINFPFDAPEFLINKFSVQLFNTFYYYKELRKFNSSIVHYNPFFFPLDAVLNWNRIYGRRGFFQYQCVVPHDDGPQTIENLLKTIVASGNASFLGVLKKFGDVVSPGMLSFPRPGITLALDFANLGKKTLQLFNELDQIVTASGGALYPCKDARMPKKMFNASFPNLQKFIDYIDPQFSSSLWRRVNKS